MYFLYMNEYKYLIMLQTLGITTGRMGVAISVFIGVMNVVTVQLFFRMLPLVSLRVS